jgi:hypothetical protein
MSQSDLRLHFGVGKAATIDHRVECRLQKIEHFARVKANQILTIQEGSGLVEAKMKIGTTLTSLAKRRSLPVRSLRQSQILLRLPQ